MNDIIKQLDSAMTVLTTIYTDTHATEIADALDMLSAYREQYIEDNSQFGAGA